MSSSAPTATPTQPSVQPRPWSTPGQWTITTDTGLTVSGHLPEWAEDDPSENGVPLSLLPVRLAGVSHRTLFEGQMVSLVTPELNAEPEEDAILEGSIECNPFDPDPELRRPHFTLQVCVGYWIRGLGPDDLTRVIAQLRSQADLLEQEVHPALIAARDDWAAHETPRSPRCAETAKLLFPSGEE
jgi:hypothetical protein